MVRIPLNVKLSSDFSFRKKLLSPVDFGNVDLRKFCLIFVGTRQFN